MSNSYCLHLVKRLDSTKKDFFEILLGEWDWDSVRKIRTLIVEFYGHSRKFP
jgi:hypothetical protein